MTMDTDPWAAWEADNALSKDEDVCLEGNKADPVCTSDEKEEKKAEVNHCSKKTFLIGGQLVSRGEVERAIAYYRSTSKKYRRLSSMKTRFRFIKKESHLAKLRKIERMCAGQSDRVIMNYPQNRPQEQISEMRSLNHQNNEQLSEEPQEGSLRRRGRPRKSEAKRGKKKKKTTRRDSSESSAGEMSDDAMYDDDDDDDEEDAEEEQESDPDDPEFTPCRRSSRRQKKPVKTYNQKALFREEMSKPREPLKGGGRSRTRARTGGKRRMDSPLEGMGYWHDGALSGKRLQDGVENNEYERLIKEEISLYEQHLPQLPPVIPDPMQRLYVVRVDSVEAIHHSGAGFRLMTSCVTDDMMVSLFHVTTDRYFVNNNAEDVLQLAQVLRHVWNMLPLKKRLAWEDAARQIALQTPKIKKEIVENGEEAATENTAESEVKEDGPSHEETMPVRDFPFGMKHKITSKDSSQTLHGPPLVDAARKSRAIESSCCDIKESWKTFSDVQSHMIAAHYSALFYGCHFCGSLFRSVEALLGHTECSRWSGMLLNQMVKDGGKQMRRVEMKVAYMFIVCSDCGLWLPIRVNYPADRLPKAWCFFATVMENHTCKKLVPLIIYMAELMDVPSRDARVLIQFLPSFIKNFPYTCEECSIDAFATPDEMDLHFQKVHHIKYKCTKCGECSGTELYHKAHLSTHLSDSLLLADYLRTTCTFHPPPHCKGAPAEVGSEHRIQASGGSTMPHTSTFLGHDLIDHCDELVKMKIWNSLDNAKVVAALSEEESEEEEVDKTKHRADAAYEKFDYSTLEGSQEEKEARKVVNNCFHKIHGTSGPEEAVLDWRTRVNDPVNTMKLLTNEPTVDFSRFCTPTAADNFAGMLVAKFTKRISLPISACMELLSGNLFMKRFMFCTLCNTIVTTQSGIEYHAKSKCGVEGLLSLYCPPAPVNSQIECPVCLIELCSISALRGHMAITHGIHVEYKSGKQTGFTSESDASLQELASRYPDTRSAVARDTDIALWLRYGVLQPKSQFDMQLKLARKGIRVTSLERKGEVTVSSAQSAPRILQQRNPIQVRRASFPALEMEGKGQEKRPSPKPNNSSQALSSQGLNQHYIKPFVLVNNMLRCKFCAHQTGTPQLMRDHLQSNHVLVCRACGNGFAHRESLARHGKMGRCSMLFKDASVKHISADCGVCKKRMSLANAYLHLFREHLSSVVYGTVSGQVFPEHENLHVDESLEAISASVVKEGVVYSPNVDIQPPKDTRNTREVLVYKRPAHVTCTCYLCGMEMVNHDQLTRHLSRHPEKWTKCPFCIDHFPIAGHDSMKAHLMERHMVKKDGCLTCRYCQRAVIRGSYAHLLYMCTQTRKCALCRGEQSMKNAAEMTVHWTNRHLDILRRFQCSDCGMTFCHVEDFWAHQCRSYFMQQKCSCGFDTVFSSRTAFLLHFGMHLDEPNMTCKLCKFKFSSRVALQNHRLSHAILINSSTGRQLIILDTKLVVPEILDEPSRVKRIKEADPMDEEKRLSLDVAHVMRHIVRSVCESLGETCEMSKESSPAIDDISEAVDDDIIELDSPRVDDDLVDSGELSQVVLSAEVRVESTDAVVDAGSGMPGYVEDEEDDAIECITKEKTAEVAPGAAIVKPVVDDTADEDLSVVAEVEYAPGVSSLNASGRDKKFKCSKCSCAFMTSYALKTHEQSAHNTDAGGICDKVFGVPFKGFYFVCRNCCAAFESQQQFKTHRMSHGPTGSLSCGDCSSIAYNTPLYEHHRQAHLTADRLFYGCSHCNLMFRTDARLMHHLREAHGVTLFFFCKACHLGGTHERTIYAHVAVKSQRCRQFAMQKKWSSYQMLGVCPLNVLHFQPKNVNAHIHAIEHNEVEANMPSECVHRSFLAPTDSLITCRDCFCPMTAASFTASETFRNGGVAKELAMTLDNSVEFPFTGIFEQSANEQPPTLGRALAPRQSDIQNGGRYGVDTPTLTSRLSIRPPPQQQQFPLPVGTRVAAVAPLMSNKSPMPVKRRPNSDIITLDDEEPGPSVAKRASYTGSPSVSSQQFPKKTASDGGTIRCKICEAPMPSLQIQSLHELHRNGMKWFCLDCASAQMDEVEAMRHYFNVHVKVAEQKANEKGSLFRPLHYELQCPFPKCREPLTTLTNLRIHINKKHWSETPFASASSSCMFRFCSPFAKSKHDGQHSTYESVNGVEGNCCPLCGTLNQWNIQVANSSYTMSHIAVHGLRRYHMCRDCFVCFKGDYDCVRMKTHFEATHCTPIPKTNNRELLCKLCREVILKSHLAEHVIEKHLVTGFKSRDPKAQGKLIVKTGAVTRRFLGFDRIYHVGDDSDMD